MKRQKIMSKITSTHQRLYQLEQGFKQACLSAGQPLNYCALFLRSLNANKYASLEEELRVKAYILDDETALLKKGESFSQHMSALLAERQEVIRKLRSDLILNRNTKQLNLKQCCDKIQSIRLYNLTIIQNLANLNERLNIHHSEYNTEILKKIIQGADFLRFTLLRRHIEFSNSEDPLFLIPLRKFRNLEISLDYNRKPIVDLFCVGEDFKTRLEAADKFTKSVGEYRSLSRELLQKQEEVLDSEASESQPSHAVQSSQQTQKQTETLQKFMFPSLPNKVTKKSISLSKDSDYSHLSGMIRRLTEKQATHERLKQKQNRNMFEEKRRSNTQVNEYPDLNSQKKIKLMEEKGRNRLKTMVFPQEEEKEQPIISRSSTNKQYKLVEIENSRYSIPKLQTEQTKKNQVSELSEIIQRHNASSQKSNRKYQSPRKDSKEQQRNLEEQRTPQMSINRIKKQRKKRAMKKIQEDKCRETIWNEVNERKEEIFGEQSTQFKQFKLYRQNSKKQYSPEIQDRIIRIELLSGIADKEKKLTNIQKNEELESQRKRNIRNKKLDQGDNIRYKSPFDQLHEIRFYKKNFEDEIKSHYQSSPYQSNLSQQPIQNSIDSKESSASIVKSNEGAGQGSFSGSKQSSYIAVNPIPIPQPAQQPNKSLTQNKVVPNKSVTEIKATPDQNVLANSGQSVPLKPNIDPIINPPKQTTKTVINVPVRQLSFQPISNAPACDEKMNMTFSKGQMNEYVNSPNRVIFDQQPAQVLPKSVQIKQQSPQSQQQQSSAVLQKCKFQSKTMKESEVLEQLKSFNKQNFKYLQPFLTTNYFKNRHIILTNCIYNQQIACYCLYYPYITSKSRFIFILHLQFKEKFAEISVSFVNTFIKYIFCNDPTDKIIFLKHKQLFDQGLVALLGSQSNYIGEIKTPIKGSQLCEKSHYFERKELKCNKEQEYSNIFQSTFLFATSSQDEPISTPKAKDIYFSSSFLKKLQNTLKKRQMKSFVNYSQLESYLEQQNLPLFQKMEHNNQILFSSQFFQDCLINIRYFVYSKYFYFTVQPPYTYLYENEDVYYLLLSTSIEKKYFILADKIYEETEHVNIYQNFRDNVLNKKINDIFGNEKRKGAIVACPQFNKEIEFSFGNNSSGIMHFSLNWKEYIKGVRYFPQDRVDIQLIGPFFCGLVELDESNLIKQIYSTNITLDDIIK